MTEINFKSTYRIPVTQQGINNSKKIQLRALIGSYGGLVDKGNNAYARVSIPDRKDMAFFRKLKKIGYNIFDVFEGENIPRKNLDEHIRKCMDKAL